MAQELLSQIMLRNWGILLPKALDRWDYEGVLCLMGPRLFVCLFLAVQLSVDICMQFQEKFYHIKFLGALKIS